jgi:hypothetical protein
VLLAGLCAAPARAWTPPPATDEGRLVAYLPVARAAWPESPCAGRETVNLHADVFLAHEAAVLDQLRGWHAVLTGYAYPEACTAWLASGLSARKFCVDLVHEFGHLAGRGHTDAPGDVMNTGVDGAGEAAYPPCDALTVPPPVEQARIYVRELLPAPRGDWAIVCTPMRDRRPRCRARRAGARDRRFAIVVVRGQVVFAEPV